MTTKSRANWRTPDAIKQEVDERADRAAWLAERRNGIGGTDAAALMGVHITTTMSSAEDVTPAHVFAEKLSTEPIVEDDRNIFALGHILEPELLRRAEARWDIRTKPAGFYRRKADPFMYASPDALAHDGGIVECKTASNRSRAAEKWLAGDLSEHAYIQTQHYLAVTGRTHAYYSVGIRNDFTDWEAVPRAHWGEAWFHALAIKEWVQVGPIDRDTAVIDHLLEQEREFWAYVQQGEMPPHIAAHLTTAERFPLPVSAAEAVATIPEMVRDDLARLADLKADKKAIEGRVDEIEQRIKDAIGGAEYLVADGVRVARWAAATSTTFDRKALAADHPDIAAKYTTTKPTRRLTIPKQKASA